MSQHLTPMQKLNRACIAIKKLTDHELLEIEGIAHDQVNHIHPLKQATAAKINKLGRHNLAVLEKVKALREIINQLKENQ